MNDSTVEAILREMIPEYVKKVLFCGNDEYSSIVLLWEEEGRSGTSIYYLFDDDAESLSVYRVTEQDIRKGMKILLQIRDFAVIPNYHPTRVITVEK